MRAMLKANKANRRMLMDLNGDDVIVAADEAEAGMAHMSKVYDETGRELYMGAGDREHD